MIHVIATIEVEPGQRQQFLEHFTWVVPLVRAEEGCLEYGAATDLPTSIAVQVPTRENTVVVIEKWRDVASLEAHLAIGHMQEYRTRVKGLVKSTSLQVLQPAHA